MVIPGMTDTIKLTLFVDTGSMELFVEDGLVCFTQQLFPDEKELALIITALDSPVLLEKLNIGEPDRIWT